MIIENYYFHKINKLPDHSGRKKMDKFTGIKNSKKRWKAYCKKYSFYDYIIINKEGNILMIFKNGKKYLSGCSEKEEQKIMKLMKIVQRKEKFLKLN